MAVTYLMEMILITEIILLNANFDKYVNLDNDVNFLGKEKLKKIKIRRNKKKIDGC